MEGLVTSKTCYLFPKIPTIFTKSSFRNLYFLTRYTPKIFSSSCLLCLSTLKEGSIFFKLCKEFSWFAWLHFLVECGQNDLEKPKNAPSKIWLALKQLSIRLCQNARKNMSTWFLAPPELKDVQYTRCCKQETKIWQKTFLLFCCCFSLSLSSKMTTTVNHDVTEILKRTKKSKRKRLQRMNESEFKFGDFFIHVWRNPDASSVCSKTLPKQLLLTWAEKQIFVSQVDFLLVFVTLHCAPKGVEFHSSNSWKTNSNYYRRKIPHIILILPPLGWKIFTL